VYISGGQSPSDQPPIDESVIAEDADAEAENDDEKADGASAGSQISKSASLPHGASFA